MNNQLSISIIMPALNEEKNIGASITNTLQALDDSKLIGELICINDGSVDNTLTLMKKFAKKDSRIEIISRSYAKGFGASFWDGVDLAKNEIVLVMPGDNENNPWEILRYIDLLKHVDFVIPFVFNTDVRPRFRIVLSWLYRTIINLTFMTSLNYTNGTVLYRKSLLQSLSFRSGSFFFQTDVLIRLIKSGYLFAEVPYRLGLSADKVSSAISFPSLKQVAQGYFVLIWEIYFKRVVDPHIEASVTSGRYKELE